MAARRQAQHQPARGLRRLGARAARAARRCARTPAHELTCDHCLATAVCPIEWGPQDEESWWIDARCGECARWTRLLVSNRQAARLDLLLDRQQHEIARAADRLERERAVREIETLIEALRLDLVGPADFSRPTVTH